MQVKGCQGKALARIKGLSFAESSYYSSLTFNTLIYLIKLLVLMTKPNLEQTSIK
jgi:hypothetical protein